MRLKQTFALLWAMCSVTGCRSRDTIPEQPMPPNTILLSQMMRELSAPGFTETVLGQLESGRQKNGKWGPALLTPALIDDLRKRILGKDWQSLDRFPGWTMREVNPTVRVADKLVGKNPKLEGMSAVHPGAPPASLADEQARTFIDLGPYALDHEQTLSLDTPSTLPGFTMQGIVTPITATVTRGDGPNQYASEHAESQRLADVLNRLSVNQLEGVELLRVVTPPAAMSARIAAHPVHEPGLIYKLNPFTTKPEDLIFDLIATGHTVTVTDSRYFANFGHLHYKGQDVMMPFWINTQIAIPDTGGLFHRPRPLLVPVSHAEFEWHIRGPHINADISHYFGVDGKAEWRTMDTLDQGWVLKRDAHTYTGEQAIEVTRLVGLVTLAYMRQHARRPTLPFGGYYALGVCQDTVSAIEKKLTGTSTLFPNTADSSLFDDPRDGEVNALFLSIPKDRAGAMPEPERVFGSLPAYPGENSAFSMITIPGLAHDLNRTYVAWKAGHLQRTHGRVLHFVRSTAIIAFIAALLASLLRVRRPRTD